MGAIVWLASYPKSGNTWTLAFLHNLLQPQEGSYDINDLRRIAVGEDDDPWYDGLPKPLEMCTLAEKAQIRVLAHHRIAEAAVDLVFVKTHSAVVTEFGSSSISRDVTAGAIYVVRNPLDVVVSIAHVQGGTIDAAIAQLNTAAFRRSNRTAVPQGSWSEHVKSWTHKAHSALIVMRYEDMLAEPAETFGRVRDFVKPDLPERDLLRAIENSSFERLREQEDKHGYRERPLKAARFFRQGRAGIWQERLTAEQAKRVVDCHREQMARFGYVPEGM